MDSNRAPLAVAYCGFCTHVKVPVCRYRCMHVAMACTYVRLHTHMYLPSFPKILKPLNPVILGSAADRYGRRSIYFSFAVEIISV